MYIAHEKKRHKFVILPIGAHLNTDINEIISGIKSGKQEDFEILRRKYLPLVSREVFSFSQSGAGNESELRDEAERALLTAAVTFDESKGVGFGYFAKICIRNALISVRRSVISKEKKMEKAARDAEALIARKKRTRSFGAFEGLDPEEILEKVSRVLTPYEKTVFLLSLEGKKAVEISKTVGKDEKSVNNAIYRARAKIRRME